VIDANKRAANLLKRCRDTGIINPVTSEGSPTHCHLVEEFLIIQNEAGQEVDELAMYVRRLARVVRAYHKDNKLAADAVKFLVCCGHLKAARANGGGKGAE